ncbi:beta-glucosidase [Microbacterium sp.]|uniref:beta-glucosidase family protein n=1 Tax=Microbacterium sp. TaxID=51671 RepID=UPI003569AB00
MSNPSPESAHPESVADREQSPDLVGRLTLEEKVSLLTGGSAWGTAALPSIGLREMILSDGPSGVRGVLWDERDPSLSLPSGTSLGASWDVDLAREYGTVVAGEARRKGVDVVLGPTINLHRSPLGGRHFEAFSEDPLLTGDLAAAYVAGVQAEGVGATPKHYVANDFETDRFNANVTVSERALRELYLLAFEKAVTEARAWLVMSAYNSINGTTATENALLADPLKTTWGFDGVVVSDWTAVRTIESARQPQDLAMPGPTGPWGDDLVAAVRAGAVDEGVIDLKVERLLRLAARVGALDGFAPQAVTPHPDPVGFSRRAAIAGSVLARNDGILPVAASSLSRIALIGDGAKRPRVQGGGSATVIPDRIVTPLEGISEAFAGVEVVHATGAVVHGGFRPFDAARITNPVTGEPGAHVTHHGTDAELLYEEERFGGYILDFGLHERDIERTFMTYSTVYTPEETREERIGFASPGTGRLYVDGELALEATLEEDANIVQAFFTPPSATIAVPVQAGNPLELRYEFEPGSIVDGIPGSLTVSFGTETAPQSTGEEDALIEEAVAAARASDVAIVIVGTDEASECEGYDRDDLRLPGRQDDLVSAVVAANPRTVVVVNAGAPVEMAWRDDVAAVLLTWFPGQEFGGALADMLRGAAEPGGRLPTTWPAVLEDAPIIEVVPTGGQLAYDEGIHIGYRAWLRARAAPAYPFGHGLGYTTWKLSDVQASVPDDDGFTVRVAVENTGDRAGKHVVQVYASRPDSSVDRPVRWLAGFAAVNVDAGETSPVEVTIPVRALGHWENGWAVEPGEYLVAVGESIERLLPEVVVQIRAD